MGRNVAAAVGVLVLTAVLFGCGDPNMGDGAPATGAKAVATPPAPVPAPSGKPVLTIAGAVGNHNEGAAVAFDMSTLDAMATVTSAMYEPFIKKTVTFTGVPMVDLLARAGASPAGTTVRLHALDDYQVELTAADLRDPHILLATRADGARIPVSDGGPIRLVFPADSAVGKNKDLWIWSIDSITVA